MFSVILQCLLLSGAVYAVDGSEVFECLIAVITETGKSGRGTFPNMRYEAYIAFTVHAVESPMLSGMIVPHLQQFSLD